MAASEDLSYSTNFSSCCSFDLLPDHLLKKIFAFLPFRFVVRQVAPVCKRWNSVVSTPEFMHICERPWFFICKYDGVFKSCPAEGWAFDPMVERWHNCKLSGLGRSPGLPAASADGRICFRDTSDGRAFTVWNPMTNFVKKLPDPSDNKVCYNGVSMTARKDSKVPIIILTQFHHVNSNEFLLSIREYDVLLQNWTTKASSRVDSLGKQFPESVICDGVLYCVILLDAHSHYLITYELSSGDLKLATMAAPCALTSVRLMSCNHKLVMIGGRGDLEQITSIGIWELDTEWRQIARLPDVHFKALRDRYFSSCGMRDRVYVYDVFCHHLFVYNMNTGSWDHFPRRSTVEKNPPPPKFFAGICFEPRYVASEYANTNAIIDKFYRPFKDSPALKAGLSMQIYQQRSILFSYRGVPATSQKSVTEGCQRWQISA